MSRNPKTGEKSGPAPDGEGEGGFAARWSRMKREAKANPAPEAETDDPADPAAEQAGADAAAAEKTDDEILAELELPDPDVMKMGDNFSVFMSPRVPTRLRNRALRRLWRSNPVLANLDQLNDYDGDFTDAATAGQVVTTAYKVGRGFAQKVGEMLEEGSGGDSAAPDAAPDPGADSPIDANPAELAAREGDDVEADAEPGAETGAESARNHPPRPRKTMRFSFDDDAA
jgi:hypothetical protein